MHNAPKAMLLAVAWLAAAYASRAMSHAGTETTLVWLSSGITFAALLVALPWAWPGLGWCAARPPARLLVNGLDSWPALVFGGVEDLSMALGARIAMRSQHGLQSRTCAALMVAGAAVAALTGPTLAAAMWS